MDHCFRPFHHLSFYHCLGKKGKIIVLEKTVDHCLGEKGGAFSWRKGWSIVLGKGWSSDLEKRVEHCLGEKGVAFSWKKGWIIVLEKRNLFTRVL